MRDHRLIRISRRCAAIALLLVPVLGTRCDGPPVYVFRRYSLTSKPDSTAALPPTLSVLGYSFLRSAPEERRWSKELRQDCDGFQLYRIARRPGDISPDSLASMPPFEFELLVNHSASPALVVFYQYPLPLRSRDPGNPDGRAQEARIAHHEAVMDSAADELARKLVGSAGIAPRFAPADTERTQSPEAMRDRCKAEVSRARGAP